MSAAAWDFEYQAKHTHLESLYSKAKRLQWNADTAFDWSQPLDPSSPLLGRTAFPILQLKTVQKLSQAQREALYADLTVNALSQFLHGEQGALLVAGLLVSICPDGEAKIYAASQAMDEARHLEVFRRYIAKCGPVHPIRKQLKALLDRTLASDHWVKKLIGVQIVVEGLALATFKTYSGATSDPLLRSILTNVIRDEARHVAFGVTYVRDTLAAMHVDDREEIADFAFDTTLSLAMLTYDALKDTSAMLERVGVSFLDICNELRGSVGVPAAAHVGAPSFGGDVVVALLERVGAITERTRPKYERARLGRPAAMAGISSLVEAVEELEVAT